MRIILIGLMLTIVSGCTTLGLGKDPEPPKTIIEYREVKVPVSNTPMPPNTNCPKTDLETITPSQAEDDGLLVKAYRITVAQLRDCAELREKVINKYREISKEDAERIENVPASAANPNAPFGASGPVVAPGSSPNGPVPDADLIRQIRIERTFGDLEEQFNDLENKDYDIE